MPPLADLFLRYSENSAAGIGFGLPSSASLYTDSFSSGREVLPQALEEELQEVGFN